MLNSIKLILSLAASLDWELHRLDVKNAFLKAKSNEEIYMRTPLGLESKLEEGSYVN